MCIRHGVFNHIFYKHNFCAHVLKKYHSLEDFRLSGKFIVTQKYILLRDYAAYLSYNIACIVQRDEIPSYFRCSVTKL